MALSKKQALMLVLAFTMIFLLPAAKTVFADQQSITNSQGIELFVGDMIIIKSDQLSIQRVFLQGNLSAASYTPVQYPTNEFTFTSMSPGSFLLKLFFNYTSGYNVDVQTSNQTTGNPTVRLVPGVNPFFQISEPSTNSTTYYLSSGPSELDVDAIFQPSPISSNAYSSSSIGLLGWTGSFGDAFPLWVKLLYLVLGVQFFTVGGLWIRRESRRRRSSPRMLDLGDKIYLWVDIAFRFVLVSFVALGLIMGGEIMITLILRYMFLITVTPLSLWNLFSLGFAFGAVVIIYLVRFGLERGFDLKPIEDE
jgi:hypothetical protein